MKRMESIWQRYALTGAAIGLYFGWFFRPLREPSWNMVIGLSLLAALITMGLRTVKSKQFVLRVFVRETAVSWLQFALFLAILEGRHLVYDWGGKTAVSLFTTLMGALMGIWYAAMSSSHSNWLNHRDGT